jgi:hypothetical protein
VKAMSEFGDEYCADYNKIDWSAVDNEMENEKENKPGNKTEKGKKRKYGEIIGQSEKNFLHGQKKGKARG